MRGIRTAVVKLGLAPSAPFPANTVTLSIDGAPGQTVEIARGTWRRVELPLPNRRTVEIGIRPSFPAEFIIIRIGLLMQSASTA